MLVLQRYNNNLKKQIIFSSWGKKVKKVVSFTETGQNDISRKNSTMAVPIWKDVFVTLGTGDSIQYRITLSDTGDVIYSGKAFKRPGETNISARINDVCADYLENVLPTLSQAEFTRLNLPLTFAIQTLSGSTWSTISSVQFMNDWSYDYDYNPATMGMAFPINGKIDSRMPIVWTGYNVSSVNATIYFKDGTTAQVIIAVEISNDFNADFNADFSRSVRTAGSGTAVFLPSAWNNVDRIVVDGKTYQVVTECAKYALYYVNAFGGWDCLLIEGNTQEADSLKRYTREVVYSNRDIQNRGIHNYVNEITKGFTFHTGWLLGDQGKMMHHLINSTDVYLYDIANEEMIPVTIPATSCEYKTYKNQGNHLVDYTIQVQIAQNRIRR